jgi:hypothetical protein
VKASNLKYSIYFLLLFLCYIPEREITPKAGLSNAAPAGAMAPVIYFPGALIYSAGFNVNQNFKKKIFVNNICFNFFRSTPMNTVFPLLQSCFLLYPVYCPLTPPFPF